MNVDNIRRQLRRHAMQTAMKLMQDERTQPLMAKAMQAWMDGRRRFDEVRDGTAQGLGLPTRADVDALKGRLRRIERRLDDMAERLDGMAAGRA